MNKHTVKDACPKFGVQGRFVEAVKYKADADGNPIMSTAESIPLNFNVIVNNGLNLLRTVHTFMDFCRLGTGNSEPNFADNQLVSQVGSSNTAGANDGAFDVNLTENYLWKRRSRRFAAGSVSGKNLNEVAMAPAATGGIFCRALLRDPMGNQVTIVLLPDEVLDIVYELRVYLPPVDTVVNRVIDGVDTVVTMRRTTHLVTLQTWAGLIGESAWQPNLDYQQNTRYGVMVNALPAASADFRGGGSAVAIAVTPYVADSHLTLVTLNFGLTQGNASPAAAMYMAGSTSTWPSDGRWASPYGYWCYGFNPPLNKTPSRVAQVNVGISWGRYEPAP